MKIPLVTLGAATYQLGTAIYHTQIATRGYSAIQQRILPRHAHQFQKLQAR
jgi:hypothetical protein